MVIIAFLIGVYIGTEIQAWWSRKGAKMFIDWQMKSGNSHK